MPRSAPSVPIGCELGAGAPKCAGVSFLVSQALWRGVIAAFHDDPECGGDRLWGDLSRAGTGRESASRSGAPDAPESVAQRI